MANITAAIPVQVDEDGVWLEFTSPLTRKSTLVNVQKLIDGAGPIGAAAINDWVADQMRIRRLHNS